jgi:hypothetical protein
MGSKRTVWHIGFGWNLRRSGPGNFDIVHEVALAEEALRIDFLLLRKHPEAHVEGARTLRRLWPLLPTFTVVEYKGPSHPLRTGDLDKLWAYVHLFVSDTQNEVVFRTDICAVLAVPHRTPTLNKAIEEAKLTWENLEDGYYRVHGGQFVLYVIELDVAGPAEDDDVLSMLGNGKLTTLETYRFFAELNGTLEAGMKVQDMEGMTDVQRQMLEIVTMLPADWVMPAYNAEQRLAGLEPEQRLAGLEPEQRLAGLEPEQRLAGLNRDELALALPIELLRGLSKDYLQSLSPEAQALINERLAKP